ncbi:DNA-binding protein [Streptococcus phage CHPC928]|uniref:DNA-binding protein n=1 Tax=Streptococcus phage CHPC928 TaxID=2365049 RepID=A0A3G8FAS1_9CAUD|nr:DNA-binding protein [Streptococcus phage CHPC928]AZF90930.1 DNA-binding protein [Streptococcus phage CHPC928]
MNRLKELRKQKKLTIVELAEKIILNWEHEIKLGYDFSDLITKINHWADERNLKQADPKIQWMRITEEVGEIRDVLLKPTKFTDPQMALKDAVGDTLVTIIVLAHQLDLDVTECLSIAYDEIKNRKGKMVNGTFVKESDL